MSLATVTAWAFSIEEYMELAEVPEERQTRLAGTMLTGDAKIWYINMYKDVTPLPPLDQFLQAFKDHHQASHSDSDIIKCVETICQGIK